MQRIWLQAVLWGVVTIGVLLLQLPRWLDPAASSDFSLDTAEATAPLLPVLLLAPLVWFGGSFRRRRYEPDLLPPRKGSLVATMACSLLVGAAAVLCSALFGQPLQGMPPALHDEFSYLFQARTFLAGRLWFPSFGEMPELFDQMHVLNEGHFASRYFPGTGLWIAPFLALGNPWWGHWVANGLVAAGVVWIGRELTGLAVGVFAGLLCAVSPGLICFSNLLLAHHPTLVGLTLFLWAILACRQRTTWWLAILAGTGLTFAMLCRPMTAAGVALPFGIDWLIRLFRRQRNGDSPGPPDNTVRPTVLQTFCLGLPLLAGFGALLIDNQSITGDALMSPYQLYTDIYTPRHVYGFNNVVRGEQHLGPKVIENYDRWAENLTPRLAARNVATRLWMSWSFILGVIPLFFATVILLVSWRDLSSSWRLIAASILTLHLAHIPYWYEGIMGWHYVFESAPLWLLLFAEATRRLFVTWTAAGVPRMRLWWGALVGVCVLANNVSIEPFWKSRLSFARAEQAFSRRHYARFRTQADERAKNGPIIVFVVPDPSDRHIDYVTNPPSLTGPVLVAREQPGKTDLRRAISLFPDRHPWRYEAATGNWVDLAGRIP